MYSSCMVLVAVSRLARRTQTVSPAFTSLCYDVIGVQLDVLAVWCNVQYIRGFKLRFGALTVLLSFSIAVFLVVNTESVSLSP